MRLLEEIHQHQAHTRVIMITGHGSMESQRRAFREFKAFDFFRKEQFDSEEFRRGIQEAVAAAAHDRQEAREKGYIHEHRFKKWQEKNSQS